MLLAQGAGAPTDVWVGVSVNGGSPDAWQRIQLIAGFPVGLSDVVRVEMDDGNKVKLAIRTPVGTGTVQVTKLRMVIS